MDMLIELEKAAKWSKINAYMYLIGGFILGMSIIFLGGFFYMTNKVNSGLSYVITGLIVIVISLIIRYLFMQYNQAVKIAIQSLSSDTLEKACCYQGNVFLLIGLFYSFLIFFIVYFVITKGFSFG
ncbi:MAG: hypothetical protein IJ187_11100 [Neisseriaceae bacterium]|nr:hypothetical protein [Neisseriaceae bacterium]